MPPTSNLDPIGDHSPDGPQNQRWRLFELLGAVDIGIWYCDLPFDKLNWDVSVKEHFGLPADANVTIDTFYQRLHPEDRERTRQAIAESIANHTDYDIEYRTLPPASAPPPANESRWIRAIGRTFYDAADDPVRFDGITVDITRLKNAELEAGRWRSELTQNESQFQTLADSIPQLVWMADPTGFIFWYNRRWYEYTGKTFEDMQGWGWQSVHDPAQLPHILDSWKECLATGTPFEMVFPLRGADGSFRSFLTRVEPVRDQRGNVLRWFGTNTDISAQAQTESALRSSEERLRASLEASATGTFRWDIVTNELDWDDSLDRLFGLQPGEVVPNLANFVERVHPDYRAEVVRRCELSARVGSDFDMEFQVVRPDGSLRWIYDRGKTFKDSAGSPVYMTGACVDITERKASETILEDRARVAALGAEIGIALTASKTLPEMLKMCTDVIVSRLDAAFARIWILDSAGTTLELQASSGMYTHVNGAHSHIRVGEFKIGLIAAERKPHLTNDVLHDPRIGEPDWARREGMVAFAGYPLIVEDTLIGVAGLFARRRLGPETLDSLASIANSIALGIERKQNEAALSASEALKTAILNTALDCVITIDQESRILEFNPAAEATFGYTCAAAIGQSMPELIMPPEARELHHRGMARYLESGVGPILGKRIELEGLRLDGSRFPIELAVNRIPSNGPALFTATVRDITDRKRADEELRQARDAAESASRAKSDFLASMSHELRTPLNAIIGYSEMLQEEIDSDQHTALAEDLRRIHTAGRHLLSLISDILDLSKIEAGRMELFFESFDVASVVREVAATIEPLVKQNGNTFHLDIPEDLGTMYADITKVRQSLFNLISNAAKFTRNGDITLTLVPNGARGTIRFDVADTGVGIPPERLHQLFQPFVQLDHPGVTKQGGTGLGLAITRRFCELMGGSIAVTSEVGKGSCFTIVLPRNRMSPVSEHEGFDEAPASGPTADNRENRTTALIIDDDPAARDLLKRYLARESVDAILAGNGEEGIRMAREFRPDLITLDLMMPGMDGWAVLKTLKSDPELAEIPVVVVSILEDRSLGFSLGAEEILTKPVDRERLISILRRNPCEHPPCTVLIVEDDEDTRRMLRAMLERDGWKVIEAPEGATALKALESSSPELILLDLLMPEMDGFEFTAQLRQNPVWSKIPVVVITARDVTEEDRRRLNGQIERILEKGAFGTQELLVEVRRVINRISKRNKLNG